MLTTVTTDGILLYRWFRIGITDPEDLVWLMEFYQHQSGWKPNLVMGSLTAARNYIEKQNETEK